MVTRRIRSEYMKKFKDPIWETYRKCYDELAGYRQSRRLLEQSHWPWFWGGSDSDSDSGGWSPSLPSPCPPPHHVEKQLQPEKEECEASRTVPRLPLQEQEDVSEGKTAGPQLNGNRKTRGPVEDEVEKDQEQKTRKRDGCQHQSQQTKPFKSSKHQQHRHHGVRTSVSQQDREETRHSFALYASGEKNTAIGGKKTHNVAPTASTNQIHENALRAKTRRQVERQIQSRRAEQRRSKSSNGQMDKARKLVQPEYNPWLTEYQRCFSARSR